jgi:hypothetical protein
MNGIIKTAITADEWKKVGTTNSVAKSLIQIRAHVRQVLEGERLGMFVFGGAGLGKNYIVLDELAKHGHRELQPITPAKVNDLLAEFHHATYDKDRAKTRRQALPLVFDEARLIFDTQANLNIMKLALDGGKGSKRFHFGYIWFSKEHNGYTEDGEEKFKTVRHTGTSLAAPIIAMTNKNLHDFDRKMQDHAEALLSRVPPIMIPDDPIAVWEYVIWLALTTDVITYHQGVSLPLAKRVAIIDWFTANLHNLANVSVRTLEKVRDDFATSNDELLDEDLELHLKPKGKRVEMPGPRQLDWAALRIALEQPIMRKAA